MKKRLVGVAAVVASALAAVSLAFGGTTSLKLSADKTKLAYNKKTLKAKAGKVTITMLNTSSIFAHDIAVKGKGIKKKKGMTVGKDGISKVTYKNLPARRVHVLLHRPRPRGRGNEGQARRHEIALDTDRRMSIY